MKTRLLTPADYRTMPWKNGQGVTHEIAAERSEDDLRSGRFVWRLSRAEVGVSAPFSLFPGVDRTILLLAGDGVVLDGGDAGRHVLDRRFEPYSFPGERPLDGRLLGGPCQDFNVMVERRRARAQVTVLPVHAEPQQVTATGQTVALFALQGSLQAAIAAQAPVVLPAGHTLIVESDDAPAATRDLILHAPDGEAAALLIELTRILPSLSM